MGFCCYLRKVHDILADGRTPHERRFGDPFRAMVEYHPNSTKDHSRLHRFGKKVLPEILLGYALVAGEIWKGDIWVAEFEEPGKLDASEIHARRLNAKEILTSKTGEIFIFPFSDGTAKLSGRDYEFRESTLRQCHPVGSEDPR